MGMSRTVGAHLLIVSPCCSRSAHRPPRRRPIPLRRPPAPLRTRLLRRRPPRRPRPRRPPQAARPALRAGGSSARHRARPQPAAGARGAAAARGDARARQAPAARRPPEANALQRRRGSSAPRRSPLHARSAPRRRTQPPPRHHRGPPRGARPAGRGRRQPRPDRPPAPGGARMRRALLIATLVLAIGCLEASPSDRTSSARQLRWTARAGTAATSKSTVGKRRRCSDDCINLTLDADAAFSKLGCVVRRTPPTGAAR